MLLPLGLGLHFARLPILTLIMALILIGTYVFDSPTPDQVERNATEIVKQSKITPTMASLAYEFCRGEKGMEPLCRQVEVAIGQNGFKKKGQTREKQKVSAAFQDAIKTAQITAQFVKQLAQSPEKLEKLPSYSSYKAAKEKMEIQLAQMQFRDGLLSRTNITPVTLWWAQFKHGGLMHLFSNLFALLVFGSYVELRIGALLYLVTYFYAGFLGLFLFFPLTAPTPMHLVGASANISGLMGAFFVLFFRFRMKLLFVFFKTRTFFAQISIFFPLLYIVNEILGAMNTANRLYGGGVAHSAHLVGLTLGIAMGVVALWLVPLRWPFIYLQEDEATGKLNKISDTETKISTAEKLLTLNPENLIARHIVLADLAHSNEPITEKGLKFLAQHLPACLSMLLRKGKAGKACEILSTLPLDLPFEQILSTSGKKTLLRLGDTAVDSGNLPLALRLYEQVTFRYPKTREAAGVRKTMESILDRRNSDSRLSDFLDRYAKVRSRSILFSLGSQTNSLPERQVS